MEGSGRSSDESRAEKLMDEYLKSVGLHRKKVAKDGSCLFRAVAEQVLHCQSLHGDVRAACVTFLRKNRDVYEAFIEGDFEKYLQKLQDPQQWVGEVEINALAIMYRRDFLIFQEVGKAAVNITDNNFKDKVRLCFLNGNHYDSVYPISHMKNAAICQSVLYELLYDDVFGVQRPLLSVCQRSGRPSDLLSDDNMAACHSSDDSDHEHDSAALWEENETSSTSTKLTNSQSYRGRGRGRLLPERVRRSLNPTLLRNIDYDVWLKTKKAQQKMDYCIATGMQFSVGDRCQVRLDGGGRSYGATVKEVPVNNGLVKVLIDDVGPKSVPLWGLRPPSDDSNWSHVASRDKKSSQHGDWEVRGRGRGRGKGLTASLSLPTPTLDRRVQRTSSDEPGRPSRKAPEELGFGLTEEQRLFREEEQKNVALVEIQLRDELSFPALGAMLDTERGKKGGERKRTPSNKTDGVEAPPPEVSSPCLPLSVTPPTPEAPPSSVEPSEQSPAPTSAPLPVSTDPPAALSQPATPEPSARRDPSPPPLEAPPPPCQSAETSENQQTPPPAPPAPPPPAPPPAVVSLPQLYHDPLYPGFPQGANGGMVPTPAFAHSQSGDDLPRDVGVLRFFFNLGLKAYTLPMHPPCLYLYPLQHAHTSLAWQPTPTAPPGPAPVRYQGEELQPTNGNAAPVPVRHTALPPANVANANVAPGLASMEPDHAHWEPPSNHSTAPDATTWKPLSSPGSPPHAETPPPSAATAGNPEQTRPYPEENWEEPDGARSNHRNFRKNNRGKWGRGRGQPRRRYGDSEAGFGYTQFSSSNRGRGH